MDTIKAAEAIMAYADAHYADGGFDVIVECWTIAEIAAVIEKDGYADEAAALDFFKGLADVWGDRQAFVRNNCY